MKKQTKRVVVFAASAVLASMTFLSGTALAGKSCPSGSRFVGDRGGGVCVDVETGEVVKTIIN